MYRFKIRTPEAHLAKGIASEIEKITHFLKI